VPGRWRQICKFVIIQNAVTNGRGGKGAVVVFSTGNSATHSVGGDGYVAFPADVNIPGVLTVGASDRNDHEADYSPMGNPNSPDNQLIDVVAPSNLAYLPASYAPNPGGITGETLDIWSIDVPGTGFGYNEWPNVSPENLAVPPGEILPSTGSNYDAYTGRFGGTSAACPQVAGLAALMSPSGGKSLAFRRRL
jgi:subtilisin family serine protease